MKESACEKKQNGFTLVETLVAISIMMILSGVMLGYSRSSERQIALTTDRERVITVINRVRELALARQYTVSNGICGYGITFGSQTMQVFNTVKSGNVCPDPSAGGTVLETHSLDSRLSFSVKPSYLFFTSPYLTATSSTPFPVMITLTAGGTFSDTSLEVTGGGAPSAIIQ